MATEEGDVWVTRTEPGAGRLARRLTAAGYRVVNQPLLKIEAASGPALEAQAVAISGCEVCIALSGHAVRFGVPVLLRHAQGIRGAGWLAVGAHTAAALAREGIDAEFPETQSSEGILSSDALSRVAGQRVLLVCGKGGRELLADELARRGAEVHRFEAYRRVPEALDAEEFADRLERVGVVLAASAEVAEPLARVVSKPQRRALRVIAGSDRIARELDGLGFSDVTVADGPGDDAMLAALQRDQGKTDD